MKFCNKIIPAELDFQTVRQNFKFPADTCQIYFIRLNFIGFIFKNK